MSVSLITGLTNNDGVAQVTVNNVSGTVTFTASYSNVSAQCTVTAGSTVLFYDACDSTYKSSEYGTIIPINTSTAMTNNTAYNSSENAYRVKATGDWGVLPILALNGEDNFKLTALIKAAGNNYTYRGGLCVVDSDKNPYHGCFCEGSRTGVKYTKHNGSSFSTDTVFATLSTNSNLAYFKMELICTPTKITFNVYENDTLLGSKEITETISDKRVGLYLCAGNNYGSYMKEIKAEAL